MTERPTLKAMFTWRSAICESDLPSSARHVAITLSLYLNERTSTAYPGASRLARDTGLSERHVWRMLQLLTDSGWLSLVQQGGVKGEHRIANVYALHTPDPCLPVMGDTQSRVTSTTPTGDIHDTDPCPSVIPTLKNSKNSEGASPRKAQTKPTPIPEVFVVPDDLWTWADENCPLVDAHIETIKFVNYWKAKAKDNTKRDWNRTWQNWLIKAQQDEARRNRPRTASTMASRSSPRR